MKKLITILTIMIVLVGVAFAVDPEPVDASTDTRDQTPTSAAIEIEATIKALNPRFSLATDDATDLDQDKETDEGAAKTKATLKTSVAAGLVDSTNAVITFNIKQTTLARTTWTFNLSVEATNLIITKKYDPNNQEADQQGYVAASQAEKGIYFFQVADATPAIKSVNADIVKDNVTVADIDKNENEITVVYNGTVNPTDYTTEGVIGSFDVTWGHKNTNVAGIYSADVTLTIEAE